MEVATVSPLPRQVRLIAALALAAVTGLTGCSAGQVTQTSRQASTVIGAHADVGDLALRDIYILYPTSGVYAKGSTAQLAMVVINKSIDDDRLVDVSGAFFASASVPSSDSSVTSEATSVPTSSGQAAPSVETAMPGESSVQFGVDQYPPIELMDLSEEISVAQVVTITFVFDKAGEVTVEVPVANPTRPLRREDTFDFNTEAPRAG